jgi:large subunit ribosomal protein L3
MSRKLMGKKRGMMQVFDEQGRAVACTVIEAQPNVIVQIKSEELDGYSALQLGFDEVKTKDPRTIEKRVSKQLRGHFKKGNVAPQRHLTEVRVESTDGFNVGQELTVDQFSEIPFVDVTAISKGKGYQGVMKLHNYAGGPGSHGSSFHRHAGSTGMRTSPGRCLPGGKRASHMGLERKTIQNLEVLRIEDNCLLVKGAVPGPRNGLVYITPAKKKHQKVA